MRGNNKSPQKSKDIFSDPSQPPPAPYRHTHKRALTYTHTNTLWACTPARLNHSSYLIWSSAQELYCYYTTEKQLHCSKTNLEHDLDCSYGGQLVLSRFLMDWTHTHKPLKHSTLLCNKHATEWHHHLSIPPTPPSPTITTTHTALMGYLSIISQCLAALWWTNGGRGWGLSSGGQTPSYAHHTHTGRWLDVKWSDDINDQRNSAHILWVCTWWSVSINAGFSWLWDGVIDKFCFQYY